MIYASRGPDVCQTGLAAALLCMHMCNILHGDVNQSNCILRYAQPLWTLKLSDFGSSVILCRPGDEHARPLSRLKTSWRYAAPEVLRKEPFGLPSDMWSAGIILYELVQSDPRERAIDCKSRHRADFLAPQQALISRVLEYQATSMPGEAMHLACQLLQHEQDRRIGAESVVMDLWLRSCQLSVSGLAAGSHSKDKASLPEDAPEVWRHLAASAHMFELLHPSEISAFISSIPKLGRHAGNMLLHYILGIARYPFAVDILACTFSSLPENFQAEDLLEACNMAITQCSADNDNQQAAVGALHVRHSNM